MEVVDLLSLYRQDSVRSSQVSGFNLSITMEAGKHEAGLTSPVLTEDHLHAGKKSKPSSKLYPVLLNRLMDGLLTAQHDTTY